MSKVVISCAITGSIHTPTMSPHLPWTPDQIAGQAIGAAKAGAAILHLHARNPKNGAPAGETPADVQGVPCGAPIVVAVAKDAVTVVVKLGLLAKAAGIDGDRLSGSIRRRLKEALGG